MKIETFEGQECPTWQEMYNMIFDLQISNANNEISKYHKMIAFMQTVRPLFDEEESLCRIYGSQIAFELFVPEKDLKEKVFNIWDNPSNYWSVENLSDEAYDKFLKLLWIDFPDGTSVRLSNIAVCNDF